jgi:hypothetical protein
MFMVGIHLPLAAKSSELLHAIGLHRQRENCCEGTPPMVIGKISTLELNCAQLQKRKIFLPTI